MPRPHRGCNPADRAAIRGVYAWSAGLLAATCECVFLAHGMAWQTICVPRFGTEAPCGAESTVPRQGRLRRRNFAIVRRLSLLWDTASPVWDRLLNFEASRT